MKQSALSWYAQRLRAMSPSEVGWRLADEARRQWWERALGTGSSPTPRPGLAWPGRVPAGLPLRSRRTAPTPVALDPGALPTGSLDPLTGAARELLEGHGVILGVERRDLDDPDWLLDPGSGLRYAGDVSAFRVNYRGADDQRTVKNVWELSRQQHLTVLACAWRVTGDEAYPQAIARQLASWCTHNPVLTGVNWCSGIELACRLISWVWTRRLLDDWPGAPALFENNEAMLGQIYWHQRYLAAFHSRGSSGNNHAVAEAAGQVVASCGFPWFDESDRWRRASMARLDGELERNTFDSGLNREQAFDYHGFVAELGLLAAAEAEAAGHRVAPATWRRLCAMVDVTAAVLDAAGRPPRYGDGDDGRGVVLGAPAGDRWRSLLATGAALFGPLPWWPDAPVDLQAALLSQLVGRTVDVAGRPAARPDRFADGGLTLLRTPAGQDGPELWCRCDGGPHGFLSIAGHAHADALSVEVRVDGVDILADPGTYCYQGNPQWRSYFRSTLAHCTLQLDGEDQSRSGGPFLWTDHAGTTVLDVEPGLSEARQWRAEHDGYQRLEPPARHRRSVTLDPDARTIEIVDEVLGAGTHPVQLAYHLGPTVRAVVEGAVAELHWTGPGGVAVHASIEFPAALAWRCAGGTTDPPLGWYSAGFGEKEPTTVLIGAGSSATGPYRTLLRF